MNAEWPGVSVVMPVLNEERHLEAAVRRVLEQEYPGELEVILSVGPSKDRTHDIAAELSAADPRVRIVDNPAARTPSALNVGIHSARHDIIVRVDGHGELTDGYIARAVELLAETGAANVGGVMDARGTTAFEQAVATAYTTRLGLGGSTFHLAESSAGEAETVFLGVFQKEALLALGGFDETMHRAQDWELNYRLRKSGRRIWFSPDLRVTYRPRSSFRALIKQMYETGRWRREVVRRYPDTASPRYLAPPVAVLGIIVGLADRPGGPGHAIPAAAGRLGRTRRLRRLGGGRIHRRYAAAPAGYPTAVAAGARRNAHGLGLGFLAGLPASSPLAPERAVRP